VPKINQTSKKLMTIPTSFLDLLSDAVPAFMYLATSMPDGKPQVTPVWFSWDGTHILINTAAGRIKDQNMLARPYVSCVIQDPHNPYRYLQIRGPVVGRTEEGGYEHICQLAGKYRGKAEYPRIAGETRVIFRVLPEKVQSMP